MNGALANPGNGASAATIDVTATTVTGTAAEIGSTPAQVALAWLLARSPVMCPIPGTSSLAHLDQAIAAATLRLTDQQVTTVTAAASKHTVTAGCDQRTPHRSLPATHDHREVDPTTSSVARSTPADTRFNRLFEKELS